MQVFELHFNPPHLPTFLRKGSSPDLIFDSFCYEPENIYEKRSGSLFLVGELRNVFPQNLKFLDNFAAFFKKQYYSAPIKSSPEASLKESLKKANGFLEGIVRADDVSWLGNLNLAVLGLTARKNNWWEINFTKVGAIKILLLRQGQIIDIGKNLEFSEIEPYPLKIFSNIVSGKLAENDIVAVLTKETFDCFSSQGLLGEIARTVPFHKNFGERLKKILKTREKELLKKSGICFLCLLTKEGLPGEKKPKSSLIFQKEPEKFSIAQVFLPVLKITNPVRKFFSNRVKSVKNRTRQGGTTQNIRQILNNFPKLSSLKLAKLSLKLPKLPFPRFPSFKFKIFPLSKNLILILFLLLFLLFGFFIFKGERVQQLKSAQQALEEAKLKKTQAENFLILKNEEKAAVLFEEAWEQILPQTKSGALLRKEALSLKEEIEEELFSLSKLETIIEPDLFFGFKKDEISLLPQKMLSSSSDLYFFNPAASKFYKLSVKEKIGEVSEAKKNLKLGGVFQDSPLFFSGPNFLLSFRENSWREIILQKPADSFNFDKFAVFKSNIYFIDKKSGEIAKYSLSAEKIPLLPELWLSPQTKKPLGAKSMAIDGSIWILTEDKEILRYYQGVFKETLKLNLFPYLKNPAKIWVCEFTPYLYLLDPAEKRIVIVTKEGKIVKQLQSEKFDNLLDFAVSEDGKTIWLLNGLKVYKLAISIPL